MIFVFAMKMLCLGGLNKEYHMLVAPERERESRRRSFETHKNKGRFTLITTASSKLNLKWVYKAGLWDKCPQFS